MKIKEVTKDLKSLLDFINDGAKGKIKNLSEVDAETLDNAAIEIFKNAKESEILAGIEDIAEMNILKINIHFFDNLPKIWSVVQNGTEVEVRV